MSKKSRRSGLLSIEDMSRDDITGLLDRAERLRTCESLPQSLAGSVIGLLFLQPSTRTRVGFHVAAVRLGASVVEAITQKYQPGMGRPESLVDTVRIVSAYCDLVVLRHADAALAREAISAASAPIVNAGLGTESHPSQTLIDLFAIRRRLGRLDDLRIGIVGDLVNSRSAKSLVRALRHFSPAELRLMAPPGRTLPNPYLVGFKDVISIKHALALEHIDVLYMAGCPPGVGLDHIAEAERDPLRLTAGRMKAMGVAGIVLCPLPRIDEIARDVDALPQAAYFAQSDEGLFVRMAIMESCCYQ